MRAISVLTVIILLAVGQGSAQEVSVGDSNLIRIVKNGWEKVRINWERDPLSTPAGENMYELRNRVSTERRPRSALEERSIRASKDENQKSTPPARYVFTYKLTVENSGSKAIKELDWDYIFTDVVTGEVLGRREFTSVEKIGPRKRKELTITVSAPPAARISVHSLGKHERQGLVEKIFISRILYEDDTSWQPERQ